MRRLFNTLPGKLLCRGLALVLALPSLSLGLMVKAAADELQVKAVTAIMPSASKQLSQRPLWGVMPFVDKKGGKLGGAAADAFATELLKRKDDFKPTVDVSSTESVGRVLESLQLQAPVTDETSQLRVGQELHAQNLIRGEVVNYGVHDVPDGRQASVIIRVEVVNVASGLPINGAALQGNSTVHKGVSDEALYNEALTNASDQAVGKILSQTLPSATVLNTYTTTALINEGTRSGFADGQTVIIQRGRDQVATGRIKDVEPDLATIDIVNYTRGVSPGDKVFVIFSVPQVSADLALPGHQPKTLHSGNHGNSSGLISLLLLIGIGVFLLGSGHASSQSTLGNIVAEPTLYPESSSTVQNSQGIAAVRLKWSSDLFAGGASQRLAYQVYRSDYPTSAVVVEFNNPFTYDTISPNASFEWYNFNHVYSSQSIAQTLVNGTCFDDAGLGTATTPPVITPGRAYSYSVSEVFQLSGTQIGLTTSGSGSGTSTSTSTSTTTSTSTSTSTSTTTSTSTATTGTTGTTGTTTTTTGTTATSTGTTSTSTSTTTSTSTSTSTGTSTGAIECNFESVPATAVGLATPLNAMAVQSPSDQTTITAPTPFTFTSAVNSAYPGQFQYVLQFSTSPTFAAGSGTYTFTPFITGATGSLSTPTVDTTSSTLPSAILAASIVYWRIGARNTLDNPGPVQDISGQRYIFSPPRQFKRLTTTPPPTTTKRVKARV